MFMRIFYLVRRIPLVRRIMWRYWYQYLSASVSDPDLTFLNYGYQSLEHDDSHFEAGVVPDHERYSPQFYHYLASGAELAGKEVLEVGSGRGGGAAFVHSYMKPSRLIGVDFSSTAIQLCNERLAGGSLSFEVGNAENLHFSDNSFDVVLNVESSHCYGSMDNFLSEVYRVLRSGGHFLIADVRHTTDVNDLNAQLANSGLEMVRYEDISANVLKALEADSDRKVAFIRERAPRFLKGLMDDFAGTRDSKLWQKLGNGEMIYFSAFMRKRDAQTI